LQKVSSKVFLVHAIIILSIAVLFSAFTGICKGQEFVKIPRESYSAETFGSETFADVYSNKFLVNKSHHPSKYGGDFLVALHETVHAINANHTMGDEYQFVYLQDGMGFRVVWANHKTSSIIPLLPERLKQLCGGRYKTYVLEMRDRDITNLYDEWGAYALTALMAVEMYEKYGYLYEKCGLYWVEGAVDMQVFCLYAALLDKEWAKKNAEFIVPMVERIKVIYSACNKDQRMMGKGNEVLGFLNSSDECSDVRSVYAELKRLVDKK
jgi:hypothetical protein